MRDAAPPTGTVTFLLTDIEDSMRLWDAEPDAMRDAVARHHEILDAAVVANSGFRPVEQGEGDSAVAVFARASAALRCALDLQLAMEREAWPGTGPSVRIGLNTGEAMFEDGMYLGAPIGRCARIRDLAAGGQVFLAQSTAELVADALPEGVSLADLGPQRLRGLSRPERVWQLLHPDLRLGSRATLTSDVRLHNLPGSLTTFVGRSSELRELRGLLRKTRLLTLLGPGGCGKTRLALALAESALDRHADGVWFVDLAPLRDPGTVASTTAAAIGVAPEPGRTIEETLADRLRNRRLLVVIDNCEHVSDAVRTLVRGLLGSCPHLRVVATTRVVLRVDGETAWPVPPLQLPVAVSASKSSALKHDAGRLFVDRARLADATFEVTKDAAAAIEEVCRRLDGMPLAIELAAARVRSLPPAEIARRLDDRFRLLISPGREHERHGSVRAAVDWSYDLLEPGERNLFKRLSVFAGGFGLDAVEAVCADDDGRSDVVGLLSRLVDRSMVVAGTGSGGRARYRLLETLREYASQELEDREEAILRERHFRYFLDLAREGALYTAIEQAVGPEGAVNPLADQRRDLRSTPPEMDQVGWLDRFEEELDNFRAALAWASGSDPADGLALAISLYGLWHNRGREREGRAWLERMLEGDQELALRALGLGCAGNLAWRQMDYDGANAHLRSGVAIAKQIGDPQGLAAALRSFAFCAVVWDGDAARAAALEALEIARAVGNRALEGGALHALSFVELSWASSSQALEYAQQALEHIRERGVPYEISTALQLLAAAAVRVGDMDRARVAEVESLRIKWRLRDWGSMPAGLLVMARIAVAEGDHERALRLAGTAQAIQERSGFYLDPRSNERVERGLAPSRRALGRRASTFEKQGRQLSADEAIAYALGRDVFARPREADPDRTLTGREREVAGLVASGLTNRQIAEKLALSTRTIDAHVEHIRNKLGIRTRAQIAAWVTRGGAP